MSWASYSFSYTDFAAASTEDDAIIFSLGMFQVVEKVLMKTSSSFEGGAITLVTAEVGIASETDKYASAYDLTQPTSNSNHQLSLAPGIESFSGATDLLVTIKATGDDLSELTAGELLIWVQVSNLP